MINNIVRFTLTLVVIVLAAAPAAGQQLIFADGFESGDTSAWNPGVSITLGNTSAVSPVGDDESLAQLRIDTTVANATGEDVFVEKTMCRAGGVSPECGVYFTIEDSAGLEYTDGVVAAQMVLPGPPQGDTTTHWIVGNGGDRDFKLFVSFDNTGGSAGFYHLRQVGDTYDNDGNDTNGELLFVLNNFSTDFVFVDSQDTQNLTDDERVERLIDALPYTPGTPGVYTFIEYAPGRLVLVDEWYQ